MAGGDLAAAEQNFRAGLEIREQLVAMAPGNTGWQRDLGMSYNRLGDVQLAADDPIAAEESYRTGLEIAARLAATDPSNAGWQRDAYIFSYKMARLYRDHGRKSDASASIEDAILRCLALIEIAPNNSRFQTDLRVLQAFQKAL
ncbi:MAG: hypothetical protein AB8B85_15185 [Paracoccaceae bacterium]